MGVRPEASVSRKPRLRSWAPQIADRRQGQQTGVDPPRAAHGANDRRRCRGSSRRPDPGPPRRATPRSAYRPPLAPLDRQASRHRRRPSAHAPRRVHHGRPRRRRAGRTAIARLRDGTVVDRAANRARPTVERCSGESSWPTLARTVSLVRGFVSTLSANRTKLAETRCHQTAPSPPRNASWAGLTRTRHHWRRPRNPEFKSPLRHGFPWADPGYNPKSTCRSGVPVSTADDPLLGSRVCPPASRLDAPRERSRPNRPSPSPPGHVGRRRRIRMATATVTMRWTRAFGGWTYGSIECSSCRRWDRPSAISIGLRRRSVRSRVGRRAFGWRCRCACRRGSR